MDFKPTFGKVLVSIILTLLANLFDVWFLEECEKLLNCYVDSLINGWFIWIPLLIVIYIIFSLNFIFRKK